MCEDDRRQHLGIVGPLVWRDPFWLFGININCKTNKWFVWFIVKDKFFFLSNWLRSRVLFWTGDFGKGWIYEKRDLRQRVGAPNSAWDNMKYATRMCEYEFIYYLPFFLRVCLSICHFLLARGILHKNIWPDSKTRYCVGRAGWRSAS